MDQPLFEERFPRRSSQRADDDLTRPFQDLGLHGRREKPKRKSIVVESGKVFTRRSSSGDKRPPQSYEFYHFERDGIDWKFANRDPIRVPQDELGKKVAKGKNNKITILDKMKSMAPLRRDQIYQLLDEKNSTERDNDAEWVPVLIETTSKKGKNVLAFDIVIAQSFKAGGASPRDKRVSVVGENFDLKSKGKDKDKSRGVDDHLRGQDVFAETRFFTDDGRPIDNGRVVDGHGGGQRPPQLEPIAGPPPGLQAQRLPPVGLLNDAQHNQPPIELMNNNFPLSPGAEPGNGILHLEDLLNNSGGAGAGGVGDHNHQEPLTGHSGGPELIDLGSTKPDRRRSRGRRQSGSRPAPTRIYNGSPRHREPRQRYEHSSSSFDEDSVFFDPEERSSMSSFTEDAERLIKRRGSLKRSPSRRRGEPAYRPHSRRAASYNLGRRDMVIEPARTPRRPVRERRQTIAYVDPKRITYYHRGERDRDTDPILMPLSPVVTHQSRSPGWEMRDRGGELYYPDDMWEKSRNAENYMNRYREYELLRDERELDERDARRRMENERDARWRLEDERYARWRLDNERYARRTLPFEQRPDSLRWFDGY